MLTNAFPKRSEMAIINQVEGLLRRGESVEVVAEGVEPEAQAMLLELPTPVAVHQTPIRELSRFASRTANRLNLLLKGVMQVLKTAFRAPITTLRSLNVFRFGGHARSFWLLYQVWPFVKSSGVSTDCDVVHAQYGPNGVKGVLLRQLGLLDAAIVTSFRGYDLNRIPLERGAGFYAELFRAGEIYTTDSGAMRERLVSLGCPAERVRVIPSSVDLGFWQRAAPRDFGSSAMVRFVAAGRLVKCKGISYALEAIAELREDGFSVSLAVAGDGPLRSELVALVERLGLNDCVQFHGWLDRVSLRELFESSDVFLLPSVVTSEGDEESQGLVVQEAQAMGLPVIASDVGGIVEGFIEGKTGYACRPECSEALAAKMRAVISNRARWPQMAHDARAFVEANYSQSRQTETLLRAYQDAVDCRKALVA